MTMEARITVDVDLSALDAYLVGVDARIAVVVATFADLIVNRAKELAPVKTGALRDSIQAHLAGWAADITAGESLDYAVFVEYGTVRRGAHPFMRPAIEQYAAAFTAAVQAAVSGG